MGERRKRRPPAVVMLVAAGLGTVALLGARARTQSLVSWTMELFYERSLSISRAAAEEDVFGTIEASNAYGSSTGVEGPGSAYPYFRGRLVLEPYRETRLSASGLVSAEYYGNNENDERTESKGLLSRVRWSVRKTGETVVRWSGEDPELTLTPTAVGDYEVTVEAWIGGIRYQAKRSAACRYVRREIRTLSKEDLGKFIGAVRTTLDVRTDQGQGLYGPTYKSLQYMTEIHLNLAGNKLVDRLHDGLGFATQHSALTASYEAVLQSIDGSIAIPYWDYTLDHHMAAQVPDRDRIASLWSQDVWSDDFFGVAKGPYRTIESGPFAYLKIPKNHSATVKSPYGYLRAPWNCNKDPFLMRSHSFCGVNYAWEDEPSLTSDPTPTSTAWPSCQVHWDLTFQVESLYEWVWAAGYAPHGPVHFMIGGYSHCGDLYQRMPFLDPHRPKADGSLLTTQEQANVSKLLGVLKQMAVVFPKTMWRQNYAEYPKYCSDDTPQELCHMICAEPASDVLFQNWVLGFGSEARHLFGDWISDLPPGVGRQFLETICSTPWTPGEHIEAASPIDVSFWPIHPTMERLLTWKRIVDPFKYPTWYNRTDPENSTLICATPSSGCAGHHPYDLTHFGTRVFDDNASNPTLSDEAFMTNGELYEALDPRNYKLPFIYDHFAWQHCDQEGLFFGSIGALNHALLDNTQASSSLLLDDPDRLFASSSSSSSSAKQNDMPNSFSLQNSQPRPKDQRQLVWPFQWPRRR